jgi:hypothetical protein
MSLFLFILAMMLCFGVGAMFGGAAGEDRAIPAGGILVAVALLLLIGAGLGAKLA